MRTPGLATLTLTGLIVASSCLGDSAMAAATHAKHRVASAACRPIHASTDQLVAAVLSQPWFVGKPPPMSINGRRVCVDPHGEYVPAQYQYNPATENYEAQ
jgi:hypothetical protein